MLAFDLRSVSSVSSSPPAPCLPRSYVSPTDSCMLSRPANWCAAHYVRQMAVVLTANTSADNTCNWYEPPAAPKLRTIATLSDIASMGHACASFIILAPLGFAVFMMTAFCASTAMGSDGEGCIGPDLIIVFLILGLIVVSRVATTSTGRTV